jgi:hypothetical protein
VGIGIDGTCLLMCEGHWREAMTGSISLYDRAGERHHTIYVGAAPDHGKAAFYARMEREIAHVRQLYPKARYVGIADGAQSNWDFLAWERIDCHAWNKERQQALGESIRYFHNHLHQMHYKRYADMGMPIGSDVTEAACKTLIKQRLCRSGMRWKPDGAQMILRLRALLLTQTR